LTPEEQKLRDKSNRTKLRNEITNTIGGLDTLIQDERVTDLEKNKLTKKKGKFEGLLEQLDKEE